MKSFSTLLAFFLFASLGFSQLQPTGLIPGSDYATNIYADQGVVLASVSGRLFRSEDNGMNWYQVTDGLGPGYLSSGMIAHADGVLLLSTGGREKLYRSTDNGASWEPANAGIEGPLAVQNVFNITGSDGNIFIGHGYLLKRSTDQGLTWENIDLSSNCTAMANLDDEIWVAQENQVHYSTDNGDSWGTIISDPHTHEAASVTCFAKQGERIFAGLSYDDLSALKYTEDHGVTWDTLGGFNVVMDIVVDGSDLYLRTPNGIYHSTNSGHTWSQFQEFIQTPSDFSLTENNLWVSSFSGIKRLNLSNSEVLSPEFSVGNTHDIANIDQSLFCLANSTLYRSTNDGETWENIMQNVPTLNPGFSRIESKGNKLLVSSNGQTEFAAMSQDNGDSFQEIPLTPHGTAAYMMSDDRLFSFSFTDHTFWYSDDQGENWDSATKFPANIDNGFNTFECINKVGNLLVAGFTGGVAVSENNGEHWNFHESFGSIFRSIKGWDGKLIAIAVDDLNGDRTILKSTNNGESWTDAALGFAPQNDEIVPMRLMMIEGRIYCTNETSPFDVDSGKIYALNSSGSWFEVSELGIPPMEVVCMTKTASGIFTGLRGFGVWHTADVTFGIDEQSKNPVSISLYPNPAREFIQVEAGETGDYQIRNSSGQLVQFGKLQNADEQISVKQLKSGLYTLSFLSNSGVRSARFIIK